MHSTPRKTRAQSGTLTTVPPYSAIAVILLLLASTAQAQLTIPGNNGQDGAFAPNASIQVDLSQATPGPWDTTNSSGQGVYDPEQWAVIFRFTEVTIPSGVTVTFKNHPSRAPVIWLVQGNATIAGTVNLNGAQGHDGGTTPPAFSEPGPGGFRGGRAWRQSTIGSAGMGPGGGGYLSSGTGSAGGSYRTVGGGAAGTVRGATYGNDGVFPLIGGSGGSGSYSDNPSGHFGGGAGGGAILVAARDTILLSGKIDANGGRGGSPDNGTHWFLDAGGSGGGIRLVANVVTGSGTLNVLGGPSRYYTGGQGRTRVEANTNTLSVALVHSSGVPTTPPRIFRTPGDGVPAITAMTLNGQPVPEDPRSYPTQDVALVGVGEDDSVLLAITAEHVPSGSAVTARVVRLSGVEEIIPAQFDGETGDESTWNAQVPVAGGFSTIQVHAVLP